MPKLKIAKLPMATAWAAIKAPLNPMSDPRVNPHRRPQARIKNDAGKVATEVPTSMAVTGAVANLRSSPSMAIATNAAAKNVNVRPLKNSAWQSDRMMRFFKFEGALSNCFMREPYGNLSADTRHGKLIKVPKPGD